MEKKGMIKTGDAKNGEPGMVRITGVTLEELKGWKEELPHRIQMIQYMGRVQYCKAELVPEGILGTLVIPDKKELLGEKISLGYYVDGQQLLLVGEKKVTETLLSQLNAHELRIGGTPADVLADLLNLLIEEEVPFLQHLEENLSRIEEALLSRIPRNFYQTVIRYRKQLLILHTYYEQLINMTDMIETNHNEFLSERECQRFAAFGARAGRLHDHVEMLREYVLQIREMYQIQIDVSQNHTMNLLTVVTSLFLPLSLLVGWYGMNFANMPELQWKYSYPVLVTLCVVILAAEVRFFRKKGLL